MEVIWIADGGDQEPSGRRARRTPLPLEPVAWKPKRTAVKIARPWARAMTLEGMVRRTRDFLGLLEGDGGGLLVEVVSGVGGEAGAASL
jgi:hypothetical protein